MSMDIDNLMRKTKSYWYEDGLVELLAGLFFIAIGLLLLLDWRTPQDAAYKWIFAPGFAVVTIVWILVSRRVIGWLKERITYPRTGYVAYVQPARREKLPRVVMAGVVGAAVSLAVVSSLFLRQDLVRVVPVLLGAGVAALLVRIGGEIGLVRFLVMAVWSVVVGLALAWLTSDMGLSMGLFYALLGVAALLGGVLTLGRYLRAARVEAHHD